MDIHNSEIYGEVAQPGSFVELLSLLHEIPETPATQVRMWRGQSDISWPIHSSAYRRLALTESNPTENDLTYYEKKILNEATFRGYRNFEGLRLNDLDLLARLQHHGTATRLVDATRNALVGLFFSAHENPDKIGALLGIHTDHLGGYEGEHREVTYDEAMANLHKLKHPQTWEPPRVSFRVAAQHSQFLFSALSPSKLGSLAISPEPNAVLTIAISPELEAEALSILSEVYDIRLMTLFPDLDGFGMANSVRVERWSNYRW